MHDLYHWSVIGYDTDASRRTGAQKHLAVLTIVTVGSFELQVASTTIWFLRHPTATPFSQRPTHQLYLLLVWGVVFSLLPSLLVFVHVWTFEREFELILRNLRPFSTNSISGPGSDRSAAACLRLTEIGPPSIRPMISWKMVDFK